VSNWSSTSVHTLMCSQVDCLSRTPGRRRRIGPAPPGLGGSLVEAGSFQAAPQIMLGYHAAQPGHAGDLCSSARGRPDIDARRGQSRGRPAGIVLARPVRPEPSGLPGGQAVAATEKVREVAGIPRPADRCQLFVAAAAQRSPAAGPAWRYRPPRKPSSKHDQAI
jgi:hypothetical protein